jgi:thiamine biosynthesis lipoprotein
MKRRNFLSMVGSAVVGGAAPAALWGQGFSRLGSGGRDDHFVERWSWAMGQAVHVQIFADSEARGYDAAAAALAELRRVEHKLSLFDDSSDLAELNRHAGRQGMRVDHDLTQVISAGLGFQDVTRGAFNFSVEPLMRAWGFHAPRSSEPTSIEIAEAREAVTATKVLLKGSHVSLPCAHSLLDFGGIGVGYGLDRAAAVLRSFGIRRAFIDVSGDCLAIDAPPGEAGWLVEIAGPDKESKPIGATRLRDAALATSANTVSVLRYGKAVRGHVMDPATGWPAGALVQAVVVSRTGIEADALSTGMLVAGRAPKGVLRFYSA